MFSEISFMRKLVLPIRVENWLQYSCTGQVNGLQKPRPPLLHIPSIPVLMRVKEC